MMGLEVIDLKKMTVNELRNLYNDEENEESEKLLMGLVKVINKAQNKSAFYGFLMVLIGKQNPGRRFCEIGLKEGLTSTSAHSIKNNFIQNGNKLWNYKDETGYYNILFGDKIDAKDDRKMSTKMKAFIENGIHLNNTVEECFRDLMVKIENSIHSNKEERQYLIDKINKCYEEMDLSSVSFETEVSNHPTVNKTNMLHVKLDKLIKNGVHQIVLTGAPGTGKTFYSKQFAQNFSDAGEINGQKYAFVQFHSSYDYTDFVEGLRPVQIEDGQTQFVKLDGSFKHFCRMVVEENKKGSNREKNTFLLLMKSIGLIYQGFLVNSCLDLKSNIEKKHFKRNTVIYQHMKLNIKGRFQCLQMYLKMVFLYPKMCI